MPAREQDRIRLTDARVRAAELPEGKKDLFLWDEDLRGFALRLRGKVKSYIVVYRPQGTGRTANPKKLKLGTPETIPNVKEARNLARAILGRVAAGADPIEERKEEKRKSTVAVGAMLDRYEAQLKRRQHVKRKDVLSLLRRRLSPMLRKDISELKGWELARLIEKLDNEAEGRGKEFRVRLNAFLNFCTFDARVIDANPLAGYRRGRDTRAERIAKAGTGRALSDSELASVWLAASPGTAFGRLVRFLILTGCRRNEGAQLQWEMVDLSNARIDLPATFTKQGRGHAVFVAPALGEVLSQCTPDSRGLEWVFPAPRTGGPMSGWTQLMKRYYRRDEGGIVFTLHDLRRTFRTGLSRLGVDREIAELALGHARGDLEARYNKDECEAELREAFDIWARHVIKEVTHDPSG